MNRWTALAVATALALPTLTGCGTSTADTPNPTTSSTTGADPANAATGTTQGTSCHPGTAPTLTKDTPTVAVLAGQGATVTSHRTDLDTVMANAATRGAHVIVTGITDTTAKSLLANVVLTGEGNNSLERKRDLRCKNQALTDAFTTLSQAAPTDGPPNVFAALVALESNLAGQPVSGGVDVVLLSPLSSRGGGVDLTDPATLTDPTGAVNTLAGHGLIPSCRGWRLHAIGATTGLDDITAAKLKTFWLTYTSKCGATLVAWDDHLAHFPNTTPIGAADTSQLPVTRTPTAVTATLPGDVFFAHDSAALRTDQDPVLTELLTLIRDTPGPVHIDGYASPEGDPGHNQDLSQARAETLRAYLISHAIPAGRLTATGHGATSPCPNPDLASCRRVEITITTTH